MTEVLVAVSEGEWAFDVDRLVADLQSRRPGTEWTPTPAGDPDPALGQVAVPFGEAWVLVDVLPEARGLGVEGAVEHVAEVLAVVAAHPGLPADGTVVVTDWADDLYPLTPGLTAQEIASAYTG